MYSQAQTDRAYSRAPHAHALTGGTYLWGELRDRKDRPEIREVERKVSETERRNTARRILRVRGRKVGGELLLEAGYGGSVALLLYLVSQHLEPPNWSSGVATPSSAGATTYRLIHLFTQDTLCGSREALRDARYPVHGSRSWVIHVLCNY